MSKGGVDSPELSFADIGHIQLLCVQMDRLWQSIAAKSQRDLWKRKVEQVAEEAGSLKESLDMYLSRNQRRTQEARERAELLGRVNGESSHVLTIFDEEAQAMQSARNSSRMLEESYATGVAILSQYAGQRNRLKVSLFGLPAGFVMNSVRSFGLQQTPCLSRLPLYSVSIYSLSAPPINDRCIAPPHGFSTPSMASPSGYGLLSFLCFCICIRPNLIFSSASLGGIALQLTSRSAVSKCTPGFE